MKPRRFSPLAALAVFATGCPKADQPEDGGDPSAPVAESAQPVVLRLAGTAVIEEVKKLNPHVIDVGFLPVEKLGVTREAFGMVKGLRDALWTKEGLAVRQGGLRRVAIDADPEEGVLEMASLRLRGITGGEMVFGRAGDGWRRIFGWRPLTRKHPLGPNDSRASKRTRPGSARVPSGLQRIRFIQFSIWRASPSSLDR